MEPLYKINPAEATLHITKGNSKIGDGIWSFSTLPGNSSQQLVTSTHGLLTDIHGTCSKHSENCFGHGCYAVASALRYHSSCIPAWAENTILLRDGRLWDQLETFLTLKNGKACKVLKEYWRDACDFKPGIPEFKEVLATARSLAVVKVFRIDVSGEIENSEQLRRWNEVAISHPETVFSVYTKNFEAVGEFLDGGSDFADNFVVNISQWNHCADAFLEKYAWAKLNVFEYCPTNRKDCDLPPEEVARIEALPKCPAVTRSGHHAKLPNGEDLTCTICQNCYRKTGRHIGVWSH